MRASGAGAREGEWIGWWLPLFPLTYSIHILEEYVAGFPARMSELTGFSVSQRAFLVANAVFFGLMVGAVSWVRLRGGPRALGVALATIVLINAALHVLATIVSAAYSPGLVSALLLWAPLGGFAIAQARGELPGTAFLAGVLAGIIIHAIVPLVGLTFAFALA